MSEAQFEQAWFVGGGGGCCGHEWVCACVCVCVCVCINHKIPLLLLLKLYLFVQDNKKCLLARIWHYVMLTVVGGGNIWHKFWLAA